MANEVIITLLTPLLKRLKSIDLSSPETARDQLNLEYGLQSVLGERLRILGELGIKEGWLCDKGSELSLIHISEPTRPY